MSDVLSILDRVAGVARNSGCFGDVDLRDAALRCAAKEAAAEAWYTVQHEAGGWCVSLSTADRWLSESIETDLLHFGDPIEELIEEELVELGHDPKRDAPMPTVKHLRSEDKLYTFENSVPELGATTATKFLLAYEAAFRALGDVGGGGEDGD